MNIKLFPSHSLNASAFPAGKKKNPSTPFHFIINHSFLVLLPFNSVSLNYSNRKIEGLD